MKKFYATLAAAMLCLTTTVSAREFTLQQLNPTRSEQAPKRHNLKKFVSTSASTKASDATSISGTYDIMLGDYYLSNSSQSVVGAECTLTESNGNVTISCPDFFVTNVAGKYADGKLTISAKNLGKLGDFYGKLQPFKVVFDQAQEGSIQNVNSITGTYDEATGSFVFDAYNGVQFAAYSDMLYTDLQGYWGVFDIISLTPSVSFSEAEEIQEGQWKSIGDCTFVDAWMTPAFVDKNDNTFNPAEYPITAELQQNVENENIFRVWQPYRDFNWPFVTSNESQYNGQIVFDVTDPDHVRVYAGMPAGFALKMEQTATTATELYVFNFLGWAIGDTTDSETLEAVYSYMTEENIPFDTFKDGVVTINQSFFSTTKFCNNPYSWNTKYKVSTITFPKDFTGINGVVEDNDADAPVEYFNLQGVRVANPEAGQLVIKRQGSTVSKVVIR